MSKNEVKRLYILFSESNVGMHRPDEKLEDFVIVAGTFIPYLEGSKWYGSEKLMLRAMSSVHIAKVEGYKVYFLIGYDMDENGEFMSIAIRNSLLAYDGISEDDIFRTPLTEKGYLGITDFIEVEKYQKYRKLDLYFHQYMKIKFGQKIGLLKAMTLYFLRKNRGKLFKVNRKGSSTATIVHNALIGLDEPNEPDIGIVEEIIEREI